MKFIELIFDQSNDKILKSKLMNVLILLINVVILLINVVILLINVVILLIVLL